jgi:hypothetical protein
MYRKMSSLRLENDIKKRNNKLNWLENWLERIYC